MSEHISTLVASDAEPATISFENEIPNLKSLSKQRELFHDEAVRIHTLMYHHMPQGLRDALFAVMAAEHASLLHVNHVGEPKCG